MAVSKRLRHEVLRRDNFTCRDCGRKPPGVEVEVDHVIPKALGGTDDPTNLATRCSDCNKGKSSTSPNAPMVADVAEDALRWSRAMAAAADQMLADLTGRSARHGQFSEKWEAWTHGTQRLPVPMDANWQHSVDSLLAAGLPMPVLLNCVEIAMSMRKVKPENIFRYMCGIAWNKVTELQKTAQRLAGGRDLPESIRPAGGGSYDCGRLS